MPIKNEAVEKVNGKIKHVRLLNVHSKSIPVYETNSPALFFSNIKHDPLIPAFRENLTCGLPISLAMSVPNRFLRRMRHSLCI